MTLPTAGAAAARSPANPVLPRGSQAVSAHRPAQPATPRVLQSPRAPGQLSFDFHKPG